MQNPEHRLRDWRDGLSVALGCVRLIEEPGEVAETLRGVRYQLLAVPAAASCAERTSDKTGQAEAPSALGAYRDAGIIINPAGRRGRVAA